MTSITDLFLDILKPDQVLTGDSLKTRYHHIWQMDEPLMAKALLLPESTEQIASIMKERHKRERKKEVIDLNKIMMTPQNDQD